MYNRKKTDDYNTGRRNTGYRNTGYFNTGDWNTGCRNTGDYNAGDWNTGDFNTGDGNTGDGNTGDGNTGYYNTGDRNTGYGNTGDWNKSSYNSGCFNTVEHTIFLFDKPSHWTYMDWFKSKARSLMHRMPKATTAWVNSEDMTDEEKAKYQTYETTGGYLKVLDEAERTDAAIKWWKKLTDDERGTILAIPNFDKGIFKEITGIDVDAHEYECD